MRKAVQTQTFLEWYDAVELVRDKSEQIPKTKPKNNLLASPSILTIFLLTSLTLSLPVNIQLGYD